MTSMHVDLALFKGDELLERSDFDVNEEKKTKAFELFQVHHQLVNHAADIVLDSFSDRVGLKRVTLDMPVHESGDWEKVDLGEFTIAFWCRFDV